MKLSVIFNIHPGRIHPAIFYLETLYQLVCILVAERHATNRDTSQRVHNITDGDIRFNPTHIYDGVHGQRIAVMVDTIDARSTRRRVIVLPDTEAVIDEGVVHPEDRIAGTGRDIGHHATNTVVPVGVGSAEAMPLVHELLIFQGNGVPTRLRCSSPCRRTRCASCKCSRNSNCTAR